MNITVKENEAVYVMNEDGIFECAHINVEVEEPCCSGYDKYGNIDCGCMGQYSVYCPDCDNEDMTQEQANEIIEREVY